MRVQLSGTRLGDHLQHCVWRTIQHCGDTLVKQMWAGKGIMHAGNSVWMVLCVCGDAGVLGVTSSRWLKKVFWIHSLWATRKWIRFLHRAYFERIPYRPSTCICSLQVCVPICALMLMPMMICVFMLMEFNIKSRTAQKLSWCWSSHGKYVKMRVTAINFPLSFLPLLSKCSSNSHYAFSSLWLSSLVCSSHISIYV